jgi:glutathione S-transferase
MAENHLGWFGVQARWLIPGNFAKGPAHFFDAAPEAIRAKVRDEALERVRGAVLAMGVTRHTEPEILALATRSLAAFEVVLGDQPYLFGARPCGADATVFGILAFLLSPFFESPLRRRAESFPGLVAYVDRMMTEFYPRFPWRQKVADRTEAA